MNVNVCIIFTLGGQIPAAPAVKTERWSITARFLMNTDGSRTPTVHHDRSSFIYLFM